MTVDSAVLNRVFLLYPDYVSNSQGESFNGPIRHV